jgi:transmembrane sensor
MDQQEPHTDQIIALIGQSIQGKLSPAAQAILDQWLAAEESNVLLYNQLVDPLYRTAQLEEMASYPDEELALQAFLQKRQPGLKLRRNHLFKRIAVAAAAVAAIVFGVWFYNNGLSSLRKAPGNDGMAINDIAPGKNTATLTLPNGKTINLSDTKTGVVIGAMQDATQLSYNDGSMVDSLSSLQGSTTRQSHEEMLTAITPRGGTYQFVLPDGTKVWLNAASKISFPTQFPGANRKILLSGEAYLEVARNKAKPFIVESNGQQVTVLGTHFNINAYTDEGNTKTTLLEGSVRVSSLRGGTTRQPHDEVLKPGEQATNTGSTIQVTTVDPEEAIAWKQGFFIFKSTPIEIVMRQIERWYDVKVIYQNPALKANRLSGSVSRYDKVSRILNTIANTDAVQFKIEGKQITVLN